MPNQCLTNDGQYTVLTWLVYLHIFMPLARSTRRGGGGVHYVTTIGLGIITSRSHGFTHCNDQNATHINSQPALRGSFDPTHPRVTCLHYYFCDYVHTLQKFFFKYTHILHLHVQCTAKIAENKLWPKMSRMTIPVFTLLSPISIEQECLTSSTIHESLMAGLRRTCLGMR